MNNDTWRTLKDYQWESRLTNKDRESETGYFVDSSFRFKCNFKQPISAFLVDSLKTPDHKEKSFLRWDVKNIMKCLKILSQKAREGLSDAPKSKVFNFGVFSAWKLVTCFFLEMPHFQYAVYYMLKKFKCRIVPIWFWK